MCFVGLCSCFTVHVNLHLFYRQLISIHYMYMYNSDTNSCSESYINVMTYREPHHFPADLVSGKMDKKNAGHWHVHEETARLSTQTVSDY